MILSTQILPGVYLIRDGLAIMLTPWELDIEDSPPSESRAIGLARRLLAYSFETTDDEDVSEDGKGRWVGVSRTLFLHEVAVAVGPVVEEDGTDAPPNTASDEAAADLATLQAQGYIVLVEQDDDVILCPTTALIYHIYKKYIVPHVAVIMAVVGLTDNLRTRRDRVRNQDPYDE